MEFEDEGTLSQEEDEASALRIEAEGADPSTDKLQLQLSCESCR
jgi:hypothetical protein